MHRKGRWNHGTVRAAVSFLECGASRSNPVPAFVVCRLKGSGESSVSHQQQKYPH